MLGESPRSVLLAVAVLAVGAAACGRAPVEKLDPAKVDALRAQLERSEPKAAPSPSPRKTAAAAKSLKEQRARARAALPPGRTLGALTPIGRDGRFAFVLDAARTQEPKHGATLELLDLGSDPGTLVAGHDFGDSGFLEGGPVRIAGVFELRDDGGRPVLLADLRSHGGAAAVCGWWLSSDRPRLVCAPAMPRRSSHRAWGDMLLESWDSDSPTPAGRPPGTTGRVLVFAAGGWREIDSFRCLGWKLERALGEAGGQPLGEWQRSAVQARRAAALAAEDRNDTATAVALLRDALELDGCDVEMWRILGRLDLQAGHVEAAVPSLAFAVALRPHGEAALVDLADALLALESSGGAGAGTAWPAAREILSSRKGTRELLEHAEGDRPSDLSHVLYERFLAVTERSAPRLGPQRRHAREQLERGKGTVNPGSAEPSPRDER